MTPPSPETLFSVLDATWTPARFVEAGPWCLREGKGGGQRVSAATAKMPVSETDIDIAETGMRGLGQRPIFMIKAEDSDLDDWLAARGYEVVDPVALYAAPAASLVKDLRPPDVTFAWPPFAVQRELWAKGGIGPARIAVMERADVAKTAILGRHNDAPAAVAFLGVKDDIAMLHALEVAPEHRRAGIGRMVMHGAANWAAARGAAWLTLAVTRANEAANALYRSLGMIPVTAYHYRRGPEAAP